MTKYNNRVTVTRAIWVDGRRYIGMGLLVFGLTASASAQTLSAPSRSNKFAADFGGATTLPVVSNGFLVSFRRTIKLGASANINVTRLATGTSQTLAFGSVGSGSTVLLAGGMTLSQHLLITGMTVTGTSGTQQGFIVETDLAGNRLATVNTGPFLPTRVCAGSDGSYWTLGQYTSGTGDLLRNYSSGGTLRAHYLGSTGMSGPLNLLPPGTVFGRAGATQAYLSCGDTTVGAYIGAPYFLWIEVQMATGAATQYRSGPVQNGRLTGLTLLQQGTVYGSFQIQQSDGSRKSGLYRLNLAGTAGQWVSVTDASPAAATTPVGMLLGRDGSSVVYQRFGQGPGNLSWSTIN